jgi:excinuclease Cho
VGQYSIGANSWPYPGAIGLVESFEDLTHIHVIRNWCYLGSVSDAASAALLDVQAAGFDADGYRILFKPLLSGTVTIIQL